VRKTVPGTTTIASLTAIPDALRHWREARAGLVDTTGNGCPLRFADTSR
jgi:hypothetical protein